MKLYALGSFAALALGISATVYADTTVTDDFSGTYANVGGTGSGAFTGDVVFDSTTGAVESLSLDDGFVTLTCAQSCTPSFSTGDALIGPNVSLSTSQTTLVGATTLSVGPSRSSFIDSSSLDPICNGSTCEITSMTYTLASVTTPTAAPEIDPVSATSALTLLFGGLAVLRGRKRLA